MVERISYEEGLRIDRECRRVLLQATTDHAEAITEVLDGAGLNLPKLARQFINRARKTVKFTSDVSLENLEYGLIILRLTGHGDRTLDIARRLATVSLMPYGQFSRLGGILHDARWYAHRTGDANTVETLGTYLFEPTSNPPLPRFMDGRGLKRPLDSPLGRRALGLDPAGPGELLPPSSQARRLIYDIPTLATMWAWGGSPAWSLDRIDAERERLEAAALSLPGMS